MGNLNNTCISHKRDVLQPPTSGLECAFVYLIKEDLRTGSLSRMEEESHADSLITYIIYKGPTQLLMHLSYKFMHKIYLHTGPGRLRSLKSRIDVWRSMLPRCRRIHDLAHDSATRHRDAAVEYHGAGQQSEGTGLMRRG
jgi:hypothetical protein